MKAIGYLHKYIHWEQKVDSQWIKKILSFFGIKFTFGKQPNIAPILNKYFDVMKCSPVKGKARKQQLVLTLLLEIFDAICKRHSITYYLDEGNLLGAFRYKGFVPWDDDIDVTVPLEHYERLALALKEETRGTRLKLYGVDSVRNGSILRLTLSDFEAATIDISFIYCLKCSMTEKNNIEKVWQKSKWHYWVNLWEVEKHCSENALKMFRDNTNNFFLKRLSTASAFGSTETQLILKPLFYNSPHVMDASIMFPMSKIVFEGKEYNAPANVEAYLKNIFGDIYSFPPYFTSHGDNYSEADVDSAYTQLTRLKEKFARR